MKGDPALPPGSRPRGSGTDPQLSTVQSPPVLRSEAGAVQDRPRYRYNILTIVPIMSPGGSLASRQEETLRQAMRLHRTRTRAGLEAGGRRKEVPRRGGARGGWRREEPAAQAPRFTLRELGKGPQPARRGPGRTRYKTQIFLTLRTMGSY